MSDTRRAVSKSEFKRVTAQGGDILPPEAPAPPNSWKPEVIADNSGEWCGNALRFPTKEEAEANAADLASRWMLVRDHRAAPSDDEPNYRWENGRLVEIPKAK